MEVNLSNSSYHSGTRDFTLAGSNDAENWTFLANGTLANPYVYGDCDVPAVEIPVGEREFQFVLLTAHNYYRTAPGLMFFGVE